MITKADVVYLDFHKLFLKMHPQRFLAKKKITYTGKIKWIVARLTKSNQKIETKKLIGLSNRFLEALNCTISGNMSKFADDTLAPCQMSQ